MKRFIAVVALMVGLIGSMSVIPASAERLFQITQLASDTAVYPSEKKPVATQNTVEAAGNVTSTTTIQGGTIASQILEWLKVAFGSAIGLAVTAIILKGLTYLGVQTTDIMRDQLQHIVVNGINDAAAKAEAALNGKFTVDVRNQVVADAVNYVQDHGKETIKALGLDPKSGAAVDAIKARIETAIIDPATPTNPALSVDKKVVV